MLPPFGTFLDIFYHRMNKIGITHHLGYVSPVFDVARNLLVVSIRDGQAQDRRLATLRAVPAFLRSREVQELRVDVLVCGAISRPCEAALLASGIEVISSVCGPIEEVLGAFLNGTLGDAKFVMPGFNPRRYRGRHGKKRQR